MNTCHVVVDSPLDDLTLITDGTTLIAVCFQEHRHASPIEDRGERTDLTRAPRVLQEAAHQLAEYFAGTRTDFDLPLAPCGTDFQRRVWAGLCEIPYGQTRTYGQLAARLGMPGAARAVGLANGRNPVSVVVPCHRVIGADGSLTGYGGGHRRKQTLLSLEQPRLW